MGLALFARSTEASHFAEGDGGEYQQHEDHADASGGQSKRVPSLFEP